MKNKSGKIVAVAVLGLAGVLCIALLTAGYLKKTSTAKKASQNQQISQADRMQLCKPDFFFYGFCSGGCSGESESVDSDSEAAG